MHNYQLYRTNPRLSGQLKWDLTIDAYDGDLYVEKMGLSPLADSLSVSKTVKQDLLRYSHQANVCRFYKQHKDIFFNANGDQKLEGSYPIINNSTDTQIQSNQFDMTYNMGVRRVSHKLYGKQFSILTPVWLEKMSDKIRFRFDKYIGQTYIGCKYLTLSDNGSTKKLRHDQFTKYFFDYVKYMQLNDSENWKGDELISIDLKTNDSSICGLSVESGVKNSKPILYLSRNLKDREMTMMEFDEKILVEFEKNRMICPQIFNFNFVFDIDDMLNEWEKRQFSEQISSFNIKVSAEIKIGEEVESAKGENGELINRTVDIFEQLVAVDFYNNYEYISKTDSRSNVLDYLQDYRHMSLIDKNKLCPSIFHWSLIDNDSYIFNLYDGFSATGTSKNYDGAPNLFIGDYHPYLFNDKWMVNSITDLWYEFVRENDSLIFLDKIMNNDVLDYKNRMVLFEKGDSWVNNVKYNSIDDIYIGVFKLFNTQKVQEILKTTDQDKEIFHPLLINEELGYDLCYKSFFKGDVHYWIFICLSKSDEVKSKLTFANLIETIPDFADIFKDFNRFENPPLITIEKSINSIIKADSPSINSEEIRGYQWTHLNKYLYRYSGKLRPSFINISQYIDDNNDTNQGRTNKLYYKSRINSKVYNRTPYKYYFGSKFPAKYPSLGYYTIDSIRMPYLAKPENVNLINEDSWFNLSNMLYLPSKMNWQIVHDQAKLKMEIKDIVREEFRKLYGDKKYDYIMSLYDYESSFDYENNTTVSQYKYDIKLTLK